MTNDFADKSRSRSDKLGANKVITCDDALTSSDYLGRFCPNWQAHVGERAGKDERALNSATCSTFGRPRASSSPAALSGRARANWLPWATSLRPSWPVSGALQEALVSSRPAELAGWRARVAQQCARAKRDELARLSLVLGQRKFIALADMISSRQDLFASRRARVGESNRARGLIPINGQREPFRSNVKSLPISCWLDRRSSIWPARPQLFTAHLRLVANGRADRCAQLCSTRLQLARTEARRSTGEHPLCAPFFSRAQRARRKGQIGLQ